MSRKKTEYTREEIAKQFELPERQSKIATLLKQDGQAYCICRSSDSSRFMIGCDACEEWYHGDCINITEKEAKLIKQYFCVRCREEDSTLETLYRPPIVPKPPGTATSSNKEKEGSSEDKRIKKRKDKEIKTSSKRCGQCMGCYRTDDCGRCDACKDMRKYGGSSRMKLRCKHRTCINSLQGMTPVKRRRKGSEDTPPAINPLLQTNEPRQCYGPRCVNHARWGSKYCSDECGTNLATNRIYQVLPQRIQEWALSPCAAESKNRQALEKVRAQQIEVRRTLEELDKRHSDLDRIILRGKQTLTDPKAENDLMTDDSDLSMHCITCGHEIHNRTAIKHMEKCFNKYEAQASFGSVFKTRIEGNVMFCDFFNPINRTYCKRLRVLCPEHCKDPKPSENEVCGCPMTSNVFQLTGHFCRLPKKNCVKHYAWEKLRRAEVDMERVRQWLKLDELLEQERQLRHSMASRAGVLALMLHSTYNHEVMEQLTAAQDQEAIQRELAKRVKKSKRSS